MKKNHEPVAQVLQKYWQKRFGNKFVDEFTINSALDKLNSAFKEADLEEGSQLKKTSFYDFFNGVREPNAKRLAHLKEALCQTADDKSQFDQDYQDARGNYREIPVDPLPALTGRGQSKRSIRVGTFDYDAFSGNPSGLFDDFFRRFAADAHLLGDPNTKFEKIALHHAVDGLESGEFDVVLGIMATPDRALTLKFFTLPISLPVNAVILDVSLGTKSSKRERKRNEIQRCLSAEYGTLDKAKEMVFPIVLPTEIGGLHVSQMLGLDDGDVVQLDDYDTDDYCDQLLRQVYPVDEKRNFYGDAIANDRVPLVVADELTCLQVMKKLEIKILQSGVNVKAKASLLFGQDEGTATTHLPKYFLGFAVNRQHAEFIEYIQEAFSYFLWANYELMATELVKLESGLRESLKFGCDTNSTVAVEAIENWLQVHRTSSNDKEFVALDHSKIWQVIFEAWRKRRQKLSSEMIGTQ